MLKRALFIKTKNLGDAVILTSAVAALPNGWQVDVICFGESSPLYEGVPKIARVLAVRRGARGWSALTEAFHLYKALIGCRYNLIAQFSDDWRGAILARFLRSDMSVAMQTSRRPKVWHRSFTRLAKRAARRHSADLDVDLIRRVGLYSGEAPPYSPPQSEASSLEARAWLQERGLTPGEFLVVHPFSRWKFKELSRETIVDLLGRLHSKGERVVVSGSLSDAESISDLLALGPDLAQPMIGLSLQTLSSVLSQAKLVVSIDSLVIHLASANRVPMVAIFGPSGELNWRPWRVRHEVVEQSTVYPCRPCGQDGCGGSKVSQCLQTIDATAILNAMSLLNLR